MTTIFADGTKKVGNLLVGAEGAHSWTREYLVGPGEAKLLPSSIVASITISSINREAALALRALNKITASLSTLTECSPGLAVGFSLPLLVLLLMDLSPQLRI